MLTNVRQLNSLQGVSVTCCYGDFEELLDSYWETIGMLLRSFREAIGKLLGSYWGNRMQACKDTRMERKATGRMQTGMNWGLDDSMIRLSMIVQFDNDLITR